MDKDKKIIELKNLVEAAEISLQQARKILVDLCGSEEEKMLVNQAKQKGNISQEEEGQVIEGIFDGQNMVGPDGKKYSVPANYASKSKLVEGDQLKLTITDDGSFLYKQINLLDRDRIIGDLIMDDTEGEYKVLANNKSYKVLNASITYFKGEPGNKVTLLVPAGRESTWAAIENIFKAGEEEPVVEGAILNKIKKDKVLDEPMVSVEDVESSDEVAEVKEKNEMIKTEEKGDEFLSHDVDSHKGIQAEKPLSEESSFVKATEDKPVSKITENKIDEPVTDIFKATEKINTDDVRQVDTDLEEPSIKIPVNNFNQNSDSQGLDEI